MRTIVLFLAFALSSTELAYALDEYEIEAMRNDEVFVINGEIFEAKTYCLGWDEGDRVVFLEGRPNGVCTSAELYNLDKEESCRVWCE